jgi:hypothetical protein
MERYSWDPYPACVDFSNVTGGCDLSIRDDKDELWQRMCLSILSDYKLLARNEDS